MVLNNEVEIAIENVEREKGSPRDHEVLFLWLLQREIITSENIRAFREKTLKELAASCRADLEATAASTEA